jgi:hypothetical protein
MSRFANSNFLPSGSYPTGGPVHSGINVNNHFSFASEKPVTQLGLELTPEFEPAVPTIVFTYNFGVYRQFTQKCGIPDHGAAGSRILFAGNRGSSPLKNLNIAYGRGWFRHVAFVCIDPRRYNPAVASEEETWFDLERLRGEGYFERAFYYPDPLNVVPCVQDTGREW